MSNRDTTVFDTMEAMQRRNETTHQEREAEQPEHEQLLNGGQFATHQFVYDMMGAAADETFALLADDFRKLKAQFTKESLELLQQLMTISKELEQQRIALQNITREVFGNVENLPQFLDTKRDSLQ